MTSPLRGLEQAVDLRLKLMSTSHTPKNPLLSLEEAAGNMTHAEIVKRTQELREKAKPGRMSVRAMVEEGRNRKPGPKPSSPKSKEPMRVEDHPAFGMWADRQDMKDPSAWVRRIRAPGYDRLGGRRPKS